MNFSHNRFRMRDGALLALLVFIPYLTTMAFSKKNDDSTSVPATPDSLVVGGGCFWCVEALFETVDGVLVAKSGYAGGDRKNPTYREVVTGSTGHAEVVKVEFDPKVVSTESLLDFFFEIHDPTTLNRQGADVGTQYRSVIFTQSDEQAKLAREAFQRAESNYPDPIVTMIEPLEEFFPAEDYHQDYFKNNTNAPYCRFVIAPKMRKFAGGKS